MVRLPRFGAGVSDDRDRTVAMTMSLGHWVLGVLVLPAPVAPTVCDFEMGDGLHVHDTYPNFRWQMRNK